jgi:hypothetical protein
MVEFNSFIEEDEMKTDVIKKGRPWVVGALLLAGLVYSALAFTTKTAYASSCDCAEAGQDAGNDCLAHNSYLFQFWCDPSHNFAAWECANGWTNGQNCPD